MKHIIHFVLYLFFSLSAYAQTVSLTGKIVNQQEEPVGYATVWVADAQTKKQVAVDYSDERGRFQLEMPPGLYTIKIDFFGMHAKTFEQEEIKADRNLGAIMLYDEEFAIEEVEIVGEKRLVEMKLDKKVYNVSKDKTLVGATSLEALDNAPSVNVDVEGNISLRGDEGVTILVDGKPSNLVSASNTDLLRSLPATSIERVEVVTVPSARYDASGSTGIINIVMKKDARKGVNGSVTTALGTPEQYRVSGLLNYGTEKFDFYANVGFNERVSPGSASSYTEFFAPNTTTIDSISTMNRTHERSSQGFFTNLGFDYKVAPNTTLSYNVKYADSEGENETNLRYEDLNTQGAVLSQSIRTELEDEQDKRFSTDLGLVHEFNSNTAHKLSVDLSYSQKKDDERASLSEAYTLPATSLEQQRSEVLEKVSGILVKADYQRPIGEEGIFEAGFRSNNDRIDNDYAVFEWESDVWNALDDYTNNFYYDQWVHAVYTQYGNSWNKFSFLGGLRAEQTEIELQNVTVENVFYEKYKKDYLKLFPTAHLSYTFDEQHSLQVGYSKRIRRPHTRMLNPFRTLSDNRNIFAGNPNLDPTTTDATELSYLFSGEKLTLGSSVYYNQSDNPLQFFSERTTDDNTSATVIRNYPVNLDAEKRYGFEFNFAYNALKWLNLRGDFNIFRSSVEGGVTDSQGNYRDLSNESNGFFGNLSLMSKLPYDFSLQLQNRYRGAMKGAETKSDPMLSSDFALSKELLKKKATLTFNVNDLFNSRARKREITTDTYYSRSEYQSRERQFTLSFTYRFGGIKKRNQRGGGDTDFGDDDFGM